MEIIHVLLEGDARVGAINPNEVDVVNVTFPRKRFDSRGLDELGL